MQTQISVGSVVQKLLKVNPDLSAPELIAIVRQCVEQRPVGLDTFGNSEKINEERALELVRSTLKQKSLQ